MGPQPEQVKSDNVSRPRFNPCLRWWRLVVFPLAFCARVADASCKPPFVRPTQPEQIVVIPGHLKPRGFVHSLTLPRELCRQRNQCQ